MTKPFYPGYICDNPILLSSFYYQGLFAFTEFPNETEEKIHISQIMNDLFDFSTGYDYLEEFVYPQAN